MWVQIVGKQPKHDMPKKNNSGSDQPKKQSNFAPGFKPKKAWTPRGPKSGGGKKGGNQDQRFVKPVQPEPTVVEETTFAELGLMPSTLKAITDLGFEVPTPDSSARNSRFAHRL